MTELVTTTNGPVSGSLEANCRRFLGIPYAAAPFGANRLRHPQPHPGWTEVRDATVPGPTVPKGPYREPYGQLLPEPHIDGEECLNLNVWAPLEDGDGFPVLVWIHGGAFANGSGIVPHYDGSTFARDGIVCVTINYRLNAEGFLDTGDENTNLGLRDQIAALEWVRDNIARFGGDPDKVTIAGESAGGMSVTCLLSSPKAEGLFHRVIAQSGAGHTALTRETAAKIAAEFASRLGIEPTHEAFAAVPVERLSAEAAAVRAELAMNPDPVRWGEAAAHGMALEPVIDGDVLPRLPIESIRAGAGKGVDVLVGSNTSEYHFFAVPSGLIDAVTDPMPAMSMAGFGYPAESAALLGAGDSTPGDVLTRLITEWYFWIPAVRLAEAVARTGGNSYIYEFAWQTPAYDGRLGACHYLEVPFVFDTLGVVEGQTLTGPNPPQRLADTMHRAWVDFVRSGAPGWAPYDERSRPTMVFDVESAQVDDPHADHRAAWEKAVISR